MAWGNLIFGLIFSTIGAAIAFCLPFLVNRKNTKNKPIDDSGLESVDGSALAGQGRSITSAIYPDDLEDQKWDGPQRLKPKSTKVGTLIGMTFFALFWNGIVSIFVSKALLGGQLDGFSIFLCLFLIPFALVGCLLIVGVFKAFLGLFNPVIEVALSSGAIARGSEVDVAWEVKGNAGRIHRLQIAVIGTETARYQQGTDTVTAQSEFGFVEIVDTTNMDEISFGSLAIVIPADTMHTFSDRNNNVTWAIRVNGEIKRWPNVRLSAQDPISKTLNEYDHYRFQIW